MLAANPVARDGPTGYVGLVIASSLFAVFFGLASALLPAWFVVSMLMMPAILLLTILRPEYGALACIALTCHLIHPAIVPRVPVLGASLAAADATLALLLLYATWLFARRTGEHDATRPKEGRLLLVAAGLFGISLMISVVVSLTVWNLSLTHVLGETRDLLYLGLLPALIVILRQPDRQERFVVGFIVVGCLFSVGQILQGLLGIQIFGSAGIDTLETLGYREHSTMRAITHGLSVIIFSLLLTVGMYLLGTLRLLLFLPIFVLLLMGILLTFGRTTFATVALCLVIVVALLNLKRLPELLVYMFVFLVVASTLAFAYKPASFDAVLFRMTSFKSEIDHGYSIGWRFKEAEALLPHIQKHPFTGIGLGADYKGTRGSSPDDELNRYVHNAYLYMAGKMGLPALTLFLLMMAAIFAMGRKLAKHDPSPWVRVVGAASAVMMVRFWVSSVTEPHLMSDHGVAIIAVAGALVCLGTRRSAADMAAPRPIAPRNSHRADQAAGACLGKPVRAGDVHGVAPRR
jgi:O-antigen ligase